MLSRAMPHGTPRARAGRNGSTVICLAVRNQCALIRHSRKTLRDCGMLVTNKLKHIPQKSAGRFNRAQKSRPVGVIGENEAAVERAADAHPSDAAEPRRLSLGCLLGR
jgi:hypothetical protein